MSCKEFHPVISPLHCSDTEKRLWLILSFKWYFWNTSRYQGHILKLFKHMLLFQHHITCTHISIFLLTRYSYLLRLCPSIVNSNIYNYTKYFSGWNKWEVSSSHVADWLEVGRLEQLLKDVQESGSVCLLALPSIVFGFWPDDPSMPAVPPGEKKWGKKTAFLQPRLYSGNSLQRDLSLYFTNHTSIIWPLLASRESGKVETSFQPL